MKEVVVVQACRTAIGDFGGGLKNVSPIEMGATVLRAVLDRSGVSAADVQHVVMGQVIQTEPRDMYLSRVASVQAGVGHGTPAMNVNRLCGSGLQAIVSAAQGILVGDAKVALA
ncbi:acetyl-CoA C-acyltransferase, partial [Alcaligenes faecalis]|nr:acetyl-CoA C-acyltransferase [Alcaligenes faecalis]